MLTVTTRTMNDDDHAALHVRVRCKLVPSLLVVGVLSSIVAFVISVLVVLLVLAVVAALQVIIGPIAAASVVRLLVAWIAAVWLFVFARDFWRRVIGTRRLARDVARSLSDEGVVRVITGVGRDWYALGTVDPAGPDAEPDEPDLFVSPGAEEAWLVLEGTDLHDLPARLGPDLTMVASEDGFALLDGRLDGPTVPATPVRVPDAAMTEIEQALEPIGPRHDRVGPDLRVLAWDDVPSVLRDGLLGASG